MSRLPHFYHLRPPHPVPRPETPSQFWQLQLRYRSETGPSSSRLTTNFNYFQQSWSVLPREPLRGVHLQDAEMHHSPRACNHGPESLRSVNTQLPLTLSSPHFIPPSTTAVISAKECNDVKNAFADMLLAATSLPPPHTVTASGSGMPFSREALFLTTSPSQRNMVFSVFYKNNKQPPCSEILALSRSPQ